MRTISQVAPLPPNPVPTPIPIYPIISHTPYPPIYLTKPLPHIPYPPTYRLYHLDAKHKVLYEEWEGKFQRQQEKIPDYLSHLRAPVQPNTPLCGKVMTAVPIPIAIAIAILKY